jgi:hypothetical protein
MLTKTRVLAMAEKYGNTMIMNVLHALHVAPPRGRGGGGLTRFAGFVLLCPPPPPPPTPHTQVFVGSHISTKHIFVSKSIRLFPKASVYLRAVYSVLYAISQYSSKRLFIVIFTYTALILATVCRLANVDYPLYIKATYILTDNVVANHNRRSVYEDSYYRFNLRDSGIFSKHRSADKGKDCGLRNR